LGQIIVSTVKLGLELTEVVTVAGVSYSSDQVTAYISDAPTIPVIDGLFGEWTDPELDETGDVNDPNVDISAYYAQEHREETYFYLEVVGDILQGNAIPSTRAMNVPSEGGDSTGGSLSDDEPTQSSGTQKESPLPVDSGEDIVYIFLDIVPNQGYENADIGFGADHMIEIKGIDRELISAKYCKFEGRDQWDWCWKFMKTMEAASGMKEIESVIDTVPLNVYYHLVGWGGGVDRSEVLTIDNEEIPPSQGSRDTPSWPTEWGDRIVVNPDGGNNAWDIVNGYGRNDAQGSGENLYLRMEIDDGDISDGEKGIYYWVFYLDTDFSEEADHADYRIIVHGTSPTVTLDNWGGSTWSTVSGSTIEHGGRYVDLGQTYAVDAYIDFGTSQGLGMSFETVIAINFMTVDTAPSTETYWATPSSNGETVPYSTDADETYTCWGLALDGVGCWPTSEDWTYASPDDGEDIGGGVNDILRVAYFSRNENLWFRLELGSSLLRSTFFAILFESSGDSTYDYLVEWDTSTQASDLRKCSGSTWASIDGDHHRQFDDSSTFIEWGIHDEDIGVSGGIVDVIAISDKTNDPSPTEYNSNTLAGFGDDRAPDSGDYTIPEFTDIVIPILIIVGWLIVFRRRYLS